jgi:hypothetical protein
MSRIYAKNFYWVWAEFTGQPQADDTVILSDNKTTYFVCIVVVPVI